MRYYSTQRPIALGSFPARAKLTAVKNFDARTFCEEIGREAWGYFETVSPLTAEETSRYELVEAEEREWYPVMVASMKRGGGLHALIAGDSKKSAQRPSDGHFGTGVREFKYRYFASRAEAERVVKILNSITIRIERTRSSVTQGGCKVFINDVYIDTFGDNIVRVPKEANKDEYYGEDIGGYMSDQSDAVFTLGFIWHPYDHIYHYSDEICRKLGITQNDWIE